MGTQIYISLFFSAAFLLASFMYRLGPPSEALRYAAGVPPALKLEGPDEPPEAKIFSWLLRLAHCDCNESE